MLTKNKILMKKDKLLELELKEAAEYFEVSERTIRRWKKILEIYVPNSKYNPGKVGKEIATQIRNLDRSDNYTQKELAEIFDISQPMIGKIINNVAYRTGISGSAEVRVNLV